VQTVMKLLGSMAMPCCDDERWLVSGSLGLEYVLIFEAFRNCNPFNCVGALLCRTKAPQKPTQRRVRHPCRFQRLNLQSIIRLASLSSYWYLSSDVRQKMSRVG